MSQSQRQKSFEESLKALEAEIECANTLASLFARGSDGAYIQIRLSYSLIAELFLFLMRLLYSPIAQLFLFLVQWADCSLASSLGLLYITIYEVYSDGETERRASFREFYAVIYPSLLQLKEMEDKKQILWKERYKKRVDEERRHLSELDLELEEECGICWEIQTKVALPNCSHAMCLNCHRKWHAQSETCPFCRRSSKRVKSTDLLKSEEVADMETLGRENLKRLFNYIDKLPLYYDSYMSEDLDDDRIDPEDYGWIR